MRSRRAAPLRAAIVAGALVAVMVPTFAAPSGASTIATHVVSGYQGVVACLSPARCVVAGYDAKGVGDVVALTNGVPGKVSILRGTQGVFSVSCPTSAGCVVLGRTSNDVGAEMATLNAAGALTREVRVSTPAGVNLNEIACTSLTSCVVTGTDVFVSPSQPEYGSWNGTTFTLHRATISLHRSITSMEGLSCAAGTCVAVGYLLNSSADTAFSLVITGRGAHAAVHTDGTAALYGVSCTSAARCYAAGFDTAGGLVVSLTSGRVTASSPVAGDLFGIGCVATSCTAAGKDLVSSTFEGEIVAVANGTPATPVMVPASSGFDDLTRTGGTFVAVGLGQGTNSVVARG